VLMSGSRIECWGANGFGQLGNGTEHDTTSPIAADLPKAVTSVSAGGSHTCALTRGGGVWCWGSNLEGQSGPGERGGWSTPLPVPGFNVAITTTP
jgi:alpha-tubulin suppressor-like RCC1 family protein